MPVIPIDARAISQELGEHLNYYVAKSTQELGEHLNYYVARSTQELGEHLNYYVARSIDHRALEVIAVLATITFGVGGYMYYAIKVQSK